MRLTCAHAADMSKMVQIRNVPDALHRKLKARAADSGQTLSDYLLAELRTSGCAAHARGDARQNPPPKARDPEDTRRRRHP
jgi:Antitoxin FitA-like, ribbon-helix-helix